jgi:hypothetical protein
MKKIIHIFFLNHWFSKCLVFSLAFHFNSCNDEKLVKIINPELKDWGIFEKGSYWVYREESSNAIDSFWVDSIYSMDLEGIEDGIIHKEWRSIVLSQNNSTNNYLSSVSTLSHIVYYFSLEPTTFDPEFTETTNLVSLPPTPKERFNTSCGSVYKWIEVDSILDSMRIGIHSFRNVVKMYDMNNCALQQQESFFYSVKNVGIIRKEFPGKNEIWNLMKFHIVQ